MNELANTDMLTGLKSRTAYINKEVELNGLINSGKIEEFGMILIDLNYLKTINDEYGHEKGDIALINTATLINRVFGSEESYRIGGDEFVVVVMDTDRIEPLIAEFNKLMNEDTRIDRWEHISAAVGYGIYEKGIDNSTADVFAKTDAQMYINKKKMKEAQ